MLRTTRIFLNDLLRQLNKQYPSLLLRSFAFNWLTHPFYLVDVHLQLYPDLNIHSARQCSNPYEHFMTNVSLYLSLFFLLLLAPRVFTNHNTYTFLPWTSSLSNSCSEPFFFFILFMDPFDSYFSEGGGSLKVIWCLKVPNIFSWLNIVKNCIKMVKVFFRIVEI